MISCVDSIATHALAPPSRSKKHVWLEANCSAIFEITEPILARYFGISTIWHPLTFVRRIPLRKGFTNPSGRIRIAPVSKRIRICTGYFVPKRDSDLRATLWGLLFTAWSMLRTDRPEVDRLIPRRARSLWGLR